MSRRSLLLAGIAALTAFTTGCTAGAASSGIYVSDPAGSTPRLLAAPGGIPVWSQRGDQMCWGNEDGLMSTQLDVRVPTILWGSPVIGQPSWSPDGGEIVFIDRNREALVMLDVATRQELAASPIQNPGASVPLLGAVAMGGPSWSPDGERIAFACWDGAGDEACLVQRDGSGRRQITQIRSPRPGRNEPAPSNIGPPAWSPDGQFIAVASYAERSGAPSGVFVIDLGEGFARRVSPIVPNSEIRWVSDQKSLIFAARRQGRSEVVRVALANGGVESLTAELAGSAWDPAIRSGSTDLAVATSEGIVILGKNGTQTVAVPRGLRATAPAWSPDSDALAFRASLDPIVGYN